MHEMQGKDSARVQIAIGLVIAMIRVGMGDSDNMWIDIYKAFAHIYIGGLLVAAWIQQKQWQWMMFFFLCALEVICAVF